MSENEFGPIVSPYLLQAKLFTIWYATRVRVSLYNIEVLLAKSVLESFYRLVIACMSGS